MHPEQAAPQGGNVGGRARSAAPSGSNFVTLWCCVAGEVGVSGEVERMVSQVSGAKPKQ